MQLRTILSAIPTVNHICDLSCSQTTSNPRSFSPEYFTSLFIDDSVIRALVDLTIMLLLHTNMFSVTVTILLYSHPNIYSNIIIILIDNSKSNIFYAFIFRSIIQNNKDIISD